MALRAALFAAVRPEDVKAIATALVQKAMQGDVFAANAIFDRCFGKPKITADVHVTGEVFIEQLQSLRMAPQFLRRTLVDQPNGTVNGQGYRNGDGSHSEDAAERASEEDAPPAG